MAGLNEGARRTFGFGAMIGSVMVALKLKDKWDECMYMHMIARCLGIYG